MKLVRGNPGKRAINDAEPTPASAPPNAPPGWLSANAEKYWPMIAEQLHAAGLLTVLDVTALGLYCEAFARWHDANEKVVKLGAVVKSAHGYPIPSPYLQVANQAYAQMTRMLAEFGMTPSSRSRVTVKKPDPTAQYAKFVGKR
ncbi:phage terminase small subunit P27 family [Burkholderia pseudomallei]|uniref:phage terminase small subunit P27 family n=1 Tax=Burkholderia pseudomallei TaxID=28450 RepID=UPI001F3EB183|nr:phage terminase small subunit P27 family [Burkholderia pseudomallei]